MSPAAHDNGLQPYGEYRDSRQPWLGKMPAHWDLTTIGAITKRRSARNRTDLPLLSVLREKGVVLRASLGEDENHNFVPDDLSNYRVALAGDLVVNKMKAWQGSVGIAPCDGIVSPAYFVFELLKIEQPFAHRLFRSRPYVAFFAQSSDGVRIGQWDLSIARMKRIPVPIPHRDEQSAIVRFLAALDRRVNRFVRAKRRLIELLTEQKQAIITHAVTRGLNPNAKLKPSGKAWFADVPSDWSVVPMRRVITRAVDGPHHSPSYVDEGVVFISARNVKADRWSLDDAKFITRSDYEEFSRRIKPEVGDVLYTKGGTTGVARAVDLAFPFQVWVHIAVLKLRRDAIIPEYLALALNSTPCYEQAQLYTRGATNQDLGLGRMKGIELPLPPTLAEQDAIVEATDAKTQALRRAILDAEREIALIREYRTRLVSDVVTGKLDVRTAAARLPEEDWIELDDLAVDEVGEETLCVEASSEPAEEVA